LQRNSGDTKAKARLADTRDIVAATINPQLPERVIGWAQILDRLNEGEPDVL